jgi:hypothetical protein
MPERVWLALVLAGGALLRFWGLDFGFPLRSNFPLLSNFYVRPDESLIVQAAVLFFEKAGDPQFYAYPALLVELAAVLFALLEPWLGPFAANPSGYFLAVRAVSALAGAATVGVVYLLAKRYAAWPWAMFAAALYAVAPLPVRDAHFGVTDTLMSLFVALALWAASRGGEADPRRTHWLLPVTFFALAVATKYTAALAAPAVALGIVAGGAGEWKTVFRRLVLASLWVAAVFAALNPYVFLRAGESLGTVLAMFGVFYGGASAQPESAWSATGAALQVLRPLAWGPASWMAVPLVALALWPMARRPREHKALVVLALGVLPFIAALLPFRHPLPFRYLLPALPGLAVLAALGCARLAHWKPLRRVAPAMGAMLLAAQLAASVALVATMARKDTRSEAGEWIAANVSRDVPIVMLTNPEGEPQVMESAASLQRRMDFAYRMYGPQSGRIVSQLYGIQLRANPEGHEVYRHASPGDVTVDEVLLVTAQYPLRGWEAPAEGLVRSFGTERQRVVFDPLLPSAGTLFLDVSDAFFLPMNPWGNVRRPGPRIELVRIRRDGLPEAGNDAQQP